MYISVDISALVGQWEYKKLNKNIEFLDMLWIKWKYFYWMAVINAEWTCFHIFIINTIIFDKIKVKSSIPT